MTDGGVETNASVVGDQARKARQLSVRRAPVEVARAPEVPPVRPAGANARVGWRLDRGVPDRRREPVEDGSRHRRPVDSGKRRGVAWRPGEAPVVARPPRAHAVVSERVDLRRHEVLHQVLLDERVAEPEVPLERRVRERARGGIEERVGRAGRGPARPGEEVGVAQVVDERFAACARRRARGGVAADVAVHLLRPVAHVRVHVRPERRILEPLLRSGLVGPDLGHALADPDDPDDALRRRPLAARVVEPTEELAQVRAAVPVAAAHRGGDLVDRPACPPRRRRSPRPPSCAARRRRPGTRSTPCSRPTSARSSGGSRRAHGRPGRARGCAPPGRAAAASCPRRRAAPRRSTARRGTPSPRGSSRGEASRRRRRTPPGAGGTAAPRAGGTRSAASASPRGACVFSGSSDGTCGTPVTSRRPAGRGERERRERAGEHQHEADGRAAHRGRLRKRCDGAVNEARASAQPGTSP